MKTDCREYAVKLLAAKDRTEKELRSRLAEKGYPEEEADAAVAAMTEYGYINDRAYAEKYLRDGMNLKGLGERRLKTELLRRGVDKDTVEEALASLSAASGAERMAEVFDRRFSGADLANPKERRRIFAYFARRGFDARDIRGLINEKSSFSDIEWEE